MRPWRTSLLSGPVTYLPPPTARGYDIATLADYDNPHPARPAPAPGEIVAGGSYDLFWSLTFALSSATWQRIGGFDEGYCGYGGEDTDFAYTARAKGVELAWVGAARAYHQFHPVSSPPVEHVADILRNGAYYRAKWGHWPMLGWLEEMAGLGRVAHDSLTDSWYWTPG